MKTVTIVFIAICSVLGVKSQHSHGRHFHDSDSDYDYDHFNPFERSQSKNQCSNEPKQKEYCIPIPSRGRENFRKEVAIGEFAWKLFQNAKTEQNFALCPLSPQILLSYLTWTANGSTHEELARAVKFTRPESIQRAVEDLKYNQPNRGEATKELDIATAFFIADDVKLNSAFVTASSKKVDIERVSFIDEDANEKFRSWAKNKSRGSIEAAADFEKNTRMVLASAIYFKAKWHFAFAPAEDREFTTEDEVKKQVPTMRLDTFKFNYGKRENFEWLSIPYKSEESMIVILPNRGKKLDDFINEMDEETFVKLLSDAENDVNQHRVNFTIPKFKIETSSSLVEPLRKMGIKTLFGPKADLGYMTSENVFVSEVKQQTMIDVNEEGSILVSITQIHSVGLSVERPVKDAVFEADRPFIAMIVHTRDHVPYVICKVTDPKY